VVLITAPLCGFQGCVSDPSRGMLAWIPLFLTNSSEGRRFEPPAGGGVAPMFLLRACAGCGPCVVLKGEGVGGGSRYPIASSQGLSIKWLNTAPLPQKNTHEKRNIITIIDHRRRGFFSTILRPSTPPPPIAPVALTPLRCRTSAGSSSSAATTSANPRSASAPGVSTGTTATRRGGGRSPTLFLVPWWVNNALNHCLGAAPPYLTLGGGG